MKRRLTLLLACLFIGVGLSTAQNRRITGSVVGEDDGQPVIGASVQVKDTQIGVITDYDGRFTLNNVPPTATTLVVSYVGMITQEVAIKPNLKVVLRTSSELLDEVMVVAFGTAKKSAFTGSAKVVGSEELEMSQVTSVTNALAGAVPGLQLTSSSGAPGSTSTIRIRGFSSLNAGKDPLIIVDGAPYSGDLGNLNPNDVESMTVLKDAASNALYGARGSNGVIIITTKKAKTGSDAVITFDAKWGGNTRALQHYNVVESPAQYYEMHHAAVKSYYMNTLGYTDQYAWQLANENLFGDQGSGGVGYNVYTIPDGQYLIGQNGKLNPNATLGRVVSYNGEDYYVTPDDWEDIGTRNGLRQEYNFSASGASEKSTFYVSLGYLSNEGITAASDLERFTGRLRADYQMKKWAKVGANVSYTRFDGNTLSNNGSSTSTGNIWAFTTQIAPIYPCYIRNADGSIKVDDDGIQMMDYGNGTNAGFSRPWLSDANPIQDALLNTQNYEGNGATGNFFLNINPIEGLTATVNATYNLDETRMTYVYNPYYGQFDTTGGTVYKYHTRTYDWNFQQLINYSRSFGKHNAEIMLGHESYEYTYKELGAGKTNMFSQDNKELSGAVIDAQSAESYVSTYNTEGYFGRIQYNYDERIFLSGSYRRDASSRFDPDYRWGNFWSVGAAWILSKESWFDVSWVNELKVKASYGVQGNDDIGNYNYTDTYTITNSNNEVGTSFASKGTRDITWETNGNFNIGAEFTLFNRITGSFEYYYRKTTDMLYSFTVAPSLGYDSYYDNVGDMYNSGIELDLNINIFNRKNLKWDIRFNLSTLKNRITKLHDDKKNTTVYDKDGKAYEGYVYGNFFICEDLPIYTWYLRDYAGVDSSTGQSLWYYNVTDDSDNVIGRETTSTYSSGDYYVTNESTIPKVFGGIGTTLYAYGFDFSINCSYQLGGKQYDTTYGYFMSSPYSSWTGYFHADLLDSWTEDNPNSNIPRFQWGDTYSAGSSTRFLTSSSYFNIENINLGYTLPSKWTEKAMISSLRIYLSCENVFYWSKRKGFDPRQSYTSAANATRYSPMRTISGGLTVKF